MARSENLTIMFTDIVGFTAKTSKQSRAENAAMLKEHDRLLLPIVANFGGRRVKSIGDAMLVTFRSPTDAVRCGMALQDAVVERNRGVEPDDELHIRVALALGDVRIEAGDVFGEPVNIAARIESMTPPDEVYMGQSVYLAMNRAEVTSESLGEFDLKGIPEAVQIYRVLPHDEKLTPAGDSAYFPFGGMHRSRSESSSLVARTVSSAIATSGQVGDSMRARGLAMSDRAMAAIRHRRYAATAVVVAVASVGLVLGVRAVRAPSALSKASPFVEAAEWSVVESMAAALQREEPDSAEAALLLGHVECGRKRRKPCLERYRTAFGRDSRLSADATATRNIVQCLGWEGDLASALLRDFPSLAARNALVERTRAKGYWGRRRAVSLLEEISEESEVDHVAVAIADLEEGPDCPKRLAAVKALASLRDVRAIPALRKAASGTTIFDPNRCLRAVAKQTVGALESR
ncbi:MAG: adenylate/guanylate cyclase domain-containing protein [Myxococcota bacterium]